MMSENLDVAVDESEIAGMTDEDVTRVLGKIRDANKQRWNSIQVSAAQYGGAVDNAFIAPLRFDTFLEMFLSPSDRSKFELVFEKKMETVLKNMLAELRQMSLTAGTPAAPANGGLIVPGR